MNYNEEQGRAVRHMDGPAFVLAGPGSGKTAVLTGRILNLVKNGIPPADILVITFTRAAAEEMKERYLKLAKRDRSEVTFGTFHAVFFHILRIEKGYRLQDLISSGEKQRMLRFILKQLELDIWRDQEKMQELETAISKWKNLGMKSENKPNVSYLEEICRALEEKMRKQGKLDFDDMQLLTSRLFQEEKEILQKWQKRYRYILVDEFQDINPVQYELVQLLALPENNLFVVGDDDQSIYSFRGSDPAIMLSFPEQYPDAERFVLGINYRCRRQIVEAAGNLISHNQKRFAKELKSALAEDARICLWENASPEKEGERIAEEIGRKIKAGQDPKEITVLFRTRMHADSLRLKLEEKNIPYYMEGKEEDLYAHWIARDLFSYQELAAGNRKRENLLRILNHPPRNLGREYLEQEEVDLLSWQSLLPKEEAASAGRLIRDLERMKHMTCFARINYICHGMAYQKYLKSYAAEKGIEEEGLLRILELLQEESRAYQSWESWKEAVNLRRLRRQVEEKNPAGKVSLRSLHGAKGLEFETVFIIGMNEGKIPYKRAVEEGKIEEERRLLYVGMTRTKKELILSYIALGGSRKERESCFFKECEKFNAEENKK